ncbi:MAG: response regulator [Ignavibacteriales bacterium]
MKISYRILLINFVIVVLVFVSSTLAFYSVTRKIVTSQHSKNLLNSAKDFVYNLQLAIRETDEDFSRILASGSFKKDLDEGYPGIDFMFKINPDSSGNRDLFIIKKSVGADSSIASPPEFIKSYPNVLIKKYHTPSGADIYYGRILSPEYLNELSKKVRADLAVVQNNIPLVTSNSPVNEDYLFNIISASKELSLKNNFDITTEELSSADFYATCYNPGDLPEIRRDIKFLIFSTLPEAAELRSNINNILMVIGFAGVALSLILVLIFTEKIRRQITQLSEAADITRSGDLKHRVSMITKDELGRLGMAFNSMLDELEKNEKAKNEYTEFITLINQNPAIKEISDAALTKIIRSADFTVGRLYLVEEGTPKLLSSYGLQNDNKLTGERIDLYKRVIEKCEEAEFNFSENFPRVNSGLVSLEIRYLLIYPVVYNKKVIAVLELGSVSPLKEGVKSYLENIHHQLAIGLSNAGAFRQLENLVTELKVLNEEYQKQNEQITQQNKTLVELHNQLKEKAEELEVQKEKAIGATMLKSQFLASMSHELRTPLNSILGLTEIIMSDKQLDHDIKEKLNVVHRNSNRLMRLINDILNFSKVEAGKMELYPEDFRLKDLLGEIESQISPLTRDKNINFVIHNELSADISVNSDKFKITQVLINLLGNAVKFTEEGMVLLKTRIIENNKLQFEVTDSGIGIAEEDMQIIFEEFRQVDGTSTRKYNGTGLGLAISRRYAELLEGSLTCTSQLGKGSTFIFTVPVGIVKDIKPERDSAEEVSMATGNKASMHTVLVIDHSMENRKIISQYLTSKSYEVVTTDNITEGLRKAAELHPFAIVLNILLPGRKAWEALTVLKKDDCTSEVPVILLNTIDELNFGYGLEVYDYMLKPLSPERLSHLILKFETLTASGIQNIAYTGTDEKDIKHLNNAFAGKDLRVTALHDTKDAYKAISKMKPDLVLLDMMMNRGESIDVLYKLKTSAETKDIPVIICMPAEPETDELDLITDSIEKATIKSRGNRIDILKVIRDRIHFEEGFPVEDTSAIWIDSKPEEEDESVNMENNQVIGSNSKPKVLIVDDDTDTLFTVGEIVRKSGCETVFAKNGLECLTRLQSFRPDLILLDIMMPQLDGFGTIKKIRADRNLSDIPVFALTALAMIEEKGILIRNGFTDFVPKPVNPGVLSFKIEKLLFNKTAESENEKNISY